jgi:hypothetical protein
VVKLRGELKPQEYNNTPPFLEGRWRVLKRATRISTIMKRWFLRFFLFILILDFALFISNFFNSIQKTSINYEKIETPHFTDFWFSCNQVDRMFLTKTYRVINEHNPSMNKVVLCMVLTQDKNLICPFSVCGSFPLTNSVLDYVKRISFGLN